MLYYVGMHPPSEFGEHLGTGNVNLIPVHVINKGSGGGIEKGVAHTGGHSRERIIFGWAFRFPTGEMGTPGRTMGLTSPAGSEPRAWRC